MLEQLKNAIYAELLKRLPGEGEPELWQIRKKIVIQRKGRYWKAETAQSIASLMLDDLAALTQAPIIATQAPHSLTVSEMGKRGGGVKSEAKRAASIANLNKARTSRTGKGGWPRGKPRKVTEPPFTVIGHYEDSTREN